MPGLVIHQCQQLEQVNVKRFFFCLIKIFGETATAGIMLKKNIGHETASQVMEDCDRAYKKMADWLKDKVEAIKKAWGSLTMCQNSGPNKFNMNWAGVVQRFFKIFVRYLDLTKDTFPGHQHNLLPQTSHLDPHGLHCLPPAGH